jgi:lipopolysaccharide/colanic/teichoic acid biosynthesis glycosyltransferase
MSLMGLCPLLIWCVERYTSEQTRRAELKPGIVGRLYLMQHHDCVVLAQEVQEFLEKWRQNAIQINSSRGEALC